MNVCMPCLNVRRCTKCGWLGIQLCGALNNLQRNVQVETLTKKHHIYLTKDGRISMAGEQPVTWSSPVCTCKTLQNPDEPFCIGTILMTCTSLP
jgi:hypothetical protein